MKYVQNCIVASLVISAVFSGNAEAIDIPVTIDQSQIEDNIFSNDVYRPPSYLSDTDITLSAGESFQLNYIFNQPVTISDTFFSSDESIHILLEKPGPAGQPPVVTPGTVINYEFIFTGVSGESAATTFSGTLPGIGSGGEISLERFVEITDGTMSFSDLHLNLSVMSDSLTFTKVTLGVDADQVTSVPEPASYVLMFTGLAFIGIVVLKQRKKLNLGDLKKAV